MKTDILIDAIGYADDFMVADAAAPRRGRVITFKRVAALAAAVLALMALTVSALAAADVEPAYELLYAVSPRTAQTLKPVRSSCVSNGIRMEVISAAVHGCRAELLVGISDTEGGRIDGTVDLFDSYVIRGMGDSVGCCESQGFDTDTGTALFLVALENMDNTPIESEKITFSVLRMLTSKTVFDGPLDIDLTDIDTFSGYCPVSGAKITDLRYENGQLTASVYYSDIRQYDNHGWLWLTDKNGDTVEPSGSDTFDPDDTGRCCVYTFDIPESGAGDYTLWGHFVSCDTLIEGDWQVTFPIK